MAKENVKKFIERVNGDEDLRRQIDEQLATVTDENAIAEQLATFGKKMGLPFAPVEYKMECNKLSTDELENVAGGTTTELSELRLMCESGLFDKRMKEKGEGWWSINRPYQTIATRLEKLGIDAKISCGLIGTGLGAVNNTYRDKETGQMILHSEVCDYIKTGVKTWRQ